MFTKPGYRLCAMNSDSNILCQDHRATPERTLYRHTDVRGWRGSSQWVHGLGHPAENPGELKDFLAENSGEPEHIYTVLTSYLQLETEDNCTVGEKLSN